MRIFLLLLFICPSAFAAYSEMIIEGVKQSNGVWTAAGVADTSGFVRTTGAVTVAGATRNLPVTMAMDAPAATSALRLAARAAGPIALAAAAYDVYEWYTSGDVKACGGTWCPADGLVTPISAGDCTISTSPAYKILNTTFDVCESAAKEYFPCTSQFTQCGFVYTGISGSNQYLYQIQRSTSTGTTSNKTISFKPITMGTTVPAPSEDDYNSIPAPSPSVLASGFNNLPSLRTNGVPIKSTSFTPFSEWISDPYFKDGSWYRDRMDVSPCPTASQPTRVCIDIGPQKFEGANDPQTIPSQATGTATGTNPKEKPSFCKENPQSIACAELGELEDEELESDGRPFQITPKSPWGSDNANCPAPKIISLSSGGVVEITYQPTCDFLAGIRPAVLALAFLAALYIALGIPVGKGD